VTITLVDERFVPPTMSAPTTCWWRATVAEQGQGGKRSSRSIRRRLSRGGGSARDQADRRHRQPFDVVILGMGGDGHTASFFPGGNNLARRSIPTPRGVMTMEAEGAGEPRLTFTFSSLQDAGLLVLHIEGEGKKDVLAKAEGPVTRRKCRSAPFCAGPPRRSDLLGSLKRVRS
jgi:6-phosphogluconolactonase